MTKIKKNGFKFGLLFVAIALSGAGQAMAQTQASVVKVKSEWVGMSFKPHVGSGFLFRRQGHTYVLTSDHVLFHGNDGKRHTVYNPRWGELNATLLSADWGLGLALLEVSSDLSGDIDEWPETVEIPKANQEVVTAGFPADLDQMIWDVGGRVSIPTSIRHGIPQLINAIELTQSHGEYGMSGGPVFASGKSTGSTSETPRRFLGILSHRVLVQKPGRAAQIQTLDARSEDPSDQLFVIPAARISRWLLDPKSTLVRSPLAEMNGRLEILTEGLRFSNRKAGSFASGAIGGGDPAGIGGKGTDRSGEDEIKTPTQNEKNIPDGIQIELNTEPAIVGQWPIPRLKAWVDQVTERLKARAVVSVLFCVKVSDGRWEKVTVNSLEDFFTVLKEPDVWPVTVLDYPDYQVYGKKGPILKEIRDDSTKIMEIITQLSGQVGDDLKVKDLLHRLKIMCEVLQSEDWMALNAKSIAEYEKQLENSDPAWNTLFVDHRDDASEIYRRIENIHQKIARITL